MMAFDATWEKIFQIKKWGRYPSEEIVRFISAVFRDVSDRRMLRLLDLGCGGGAHTWFLAREGFETYGIDGSESGIRQARSLLEQDGLNAHLTVGDFTHLGYPGGYFDGVIDSSAVQHNRMNDIQTIHKEIWRVLKPGGRFCAIMINTKTTGWSHADKLEEGTFQNFTGGSIQKDLLTHFFSESEVRELMVNYDEFTLEKMARTVNNGQAQFGHFVISAQKPQTSQGR